MNIEPCPIVHDPVTGDFVVFADWSFPAMGSVVTVPAGTRTDLASVPRVLRWAVSRFAFSVEAAVAHDHLYRTGGCPERCEPGRTFTRGEADEVFRVIAVARKRPRWLAWMGWRAVVRFGAPAFKRRSPGRRRGDRAA